MAWCAPPPTSCSCLSPSCAQGAIRPFPLLVLARGRRSDGGATRSGWVICASRAPTPPRPPLPPLPPVAPDGVILRLPRLRVEMPIQPLASTAVSYANGSLTLDAQSAAAAVGGIAGCGGADPCAVELRAGNALPVVTIPPTMATTTTILVATITWPTVNRTASCPPPPPKPPGGHGHGARWWGLLEHRGLRSRDVPASCPRIRQGPHAGSMTSSVILIDDDE